MVPIKIQFSIVYAYQYCGLSQFCFKIKVKPWLYNDDNQLPKSITLTLLYNNAAAAAAYKFWIDTMCLMVSLLFK